MIASEAQERIFYALAGNLSLNNCFNAREILAAAAAADGTMRLGKYALFAREAKILRHEFSRLSLLIRSELEYLPSLDAHSLPGLSGAGQVVVLQG